ncbi:MKRN2 opposite strand protein-like [Haliotis asinina]|uniref:MKRN2 opposite strand protein-like n=1 Tax=Haliotis asinina TaxID=109174 RepID=UPI0035321DF6
MDIDEDGLRCFQHCRRDVNIICFCVPRVCPLCGGHTDRTESRIPPYPLPYPFITSSSVSSGIVLRPTLGDFLRHYTPQADLHIGLTDSTGCVHDFDEEGLHIGNTWPQCVQVRLAPDLQIDASPWDQCLAQFADRSSWGSHSYHEQDNNCFDFVLRFLHKLNLHYHVPALLNKTDFATMLVAPSTTRAAKFVSLYRQVKAAGYVCQTVS